MASADFLDDRDEIAQPHTALVPIGNRSFAGKDVLVDGDVDRFGFDTGEKVVGEILLTHFADRFPVQAIADLLEARPATVVLAYVAWRVIIRIDLEPALR